MDDVGKAVNPMIVRGQVHGGVAQGVGQAIFERTVYDADSGQLVSGSLMDYALPRADDLPDIEVDCIEVPCASNPLGVKGAGEAGAVGSAAGGDQRHHRRAAAGWGDGAGHAGDTGERVERHQLSESRLTIATAYSSIA